MSSESKDRMPIFEADLVAADIAYSLLNQEAPSELFHYTTPSALVSIAQSKELWASRAAYMNDESEHTIAFKTISDVLRDEMSRAIDQKETEYLEQILDMARGCSGGGRTFVVSFSEIGDLLSQWRAYVPQGGYALGFETKKLMAVVKPQGWSLVKCVYDSERQRSIMEYVVARFRTWYQMHTETGDASQKDLISWGRANMGLWMWSVSATFKHPSYSEERELRLINFSLDDSLSARPQLQQKFRGGTSVVIPYVPVSVAAPDSGICVRVLVVGPGPHQELARESAVDMLLELSGGPIETRRARAPHRAL